MLDLVSETELGLLLLLRGLCALEPEILFEGRLRRRMAPMIESERSPLVLLMRVTERKGSTESTAADADASERLLRPSPPKRRLHAMLLMARRLSERRGRTATERASPCPHRRRRHHRRPECAACAERVLSLLLLLLLRA